MKTPETIFLIEQEGSFTFSATCPASPTITDDKVTEYVKAKNSAISASYTAWRTTFQNAEQAVLQAYKDTTDWYQKFNKVDQENAELKAKITAQGEAVINAAKLEFTPTSEDLPPYGAPVLIKIKGTVQHVTYMRDGDDHSPDWFEPYHFSNEDDIKIQWNEVDGWFQLPQWQG